MSEPRASEMAKGLTVREGAPGSADAPQPSALALPQARSAPRWEPQERTPDKSLVGQTVGSYRVIGLLGEGGVGVVYLGEHPLVQSRVAIKVLHDEYARSADMVQRFVTEARAANLIPSPHVVPVSDFGQLEDGRAYSVMEYLDGRSLGAIIEAEGRLDTRRVLELLRQTAEGMAVAHTHGIIHRDLKPENLFVEHHPKHGEFVRILDFGVAKLTSGRDPKLTAAGAFVGTPLYSAPEQAAGKPVGPPCDIYALGAVAFELLTGEPLFDGDCMDVLRQKAHGATAALRKLPAELPPALARLIGEMLADRPSARPQSMTQVAQQLSAIARTLPSGEAPVAYTSAPAASSSTPSPSASASAPTALLRLPRAPFMTRRVIGATLLGLALSAAAIWSALPDAAPRTRGETRTRAVPPSPSRQEPPPRAPRATEPAQAPQPASQPARTQAKVNAVLEAATATPAGGAPANAAQPNEPNSAGAQAPQQPEQRAPTAKPRGERAAQSTPRARKQPKPAPGDDRDATRPGSAKRRERLGTLIDPFSQ